MRYFVTAARSGQRDPAGRREPGRRRLRRAQQQLEYGELLRQARGHGPGRQRAGGPANPAVAPGWTLPGGNLANTRDVASPITSSNVATLGVAWCVPVESTGASRMPLAWRMATRRRRSW